MDRLLLKSMVFSIWWHEKRSRCVSKRSLQRVPLVFSNAIKRLMIADRRATQRVALTRCFSAFLDQYDDFNLIAFAKRQPPDGELAVLEIVVSVRYACMLSPTIQPFLFMILPLMGKRWDTAQSAKTTLPRRAW